MKQSFTLCLFVFILVSQTVFSQTKITPTHSKDFAFEVIKNERNVFQIEQKVGSFEITNKETKKGDFGQINSPDLMKTYKEGFPNLPVISKLIEIPIGADYEIEIISFDVEEINLNDKGITNKLMPAQPSVSKCEDGKNDKFYLNEELYKTDKFYGNELAEIEEGGIMRDTRYGRLQISPLKYNPVKNILKIYSNIKIKVTFSNIDVEKEKKLNQKYASPHFEKFNRRAINYQPASSKELIDNSPITYVIVSDRMFEDQLQPFIEWKELKGYNVVEGYTDEIGGTTSEIKNFLEDLYNNPDPTAPSFVLFVGDVEQIPAWDGEEDVKSSHVTDLYYCEYTGDFLPEVYYGRFSAQNTEQLQPQIDKTLEYEKYEMSDPDYLGNALLVAGHDDTYQDPYGNGAMWYGDNYYFNEENGINTSLFLQPADNDALHDSIIEDVNEGLSYANYTAHCSSNGWADPSFSVSDVSELTNEGKYGLWVGNCCLSVKFDDDECFGEAALRAENKGAIGDIGGSNSTYWDEDYWWAVGNSTDFESEPSYEETETGAYDAMFHTETNEVNDPSKWYITQGQAVVGGNLAVEASTSDIKGYYWEIYHLMGDPSLTPYFGVPEELSVNTTPSTLMVGMNSLTVNTEAYAYVALSFKDELLDAKRADETGEVTLNFESINDVGEADLVVTAQNKQPHIGTITVSPSDQPYVTLDNLSIDDAAGNDNGEADYGEDISLDVILANVSDTYEAFNVIDTLLSDDPYISITDELQDYGDIAPESNSLVEGAFAFTVADSVPDQHTVNFAMHIGGEDSDANEYTWESDFSIKLNAPKLEIGELTIDDAGENDDGILDPGETADLVVEITNTGHADVAGVEASLNTEASELTVDENADGPYDIPEGETKTLTFTVTADDSTPIGTPVNVNIDAACENDYYKDEDTKQVVIGEIPEYLISEEGTVSTCVGLFYDSGGPDGEYNNDENYTMTFEPATSGNVIKAEFLSFAVESGYDWLKVYNGNSTSDELIGTYDSENQPETILADNTHGSLTFEFYSDNIVIRDGWEAEISCVEMNEVTFTVTDGTEPIENATVEFAESAIETDDQGEAIFVVESGEYEYSVSKTGYDQVNGTLDVSSDIAEEITMNVSTYDITFNLFEKDGDTPINGDITFDGSTQTTAEGSYTFNDVEYELDKPFTADVGGEYYDIYEGTVDVNSDKTVDVIMEPVVFDVTVLVEDQDGEGVQGATVTMTEAKEEATTDADGIAAFQLGQGSYSYQVERAGYSSDSGTVEVTGDQTEYNETAVINIENYDITFNVTDNLGDDIEAEVTLDGETQTATGGSYTFENVEYAGDIPYEVEAEECHPEEGTVHLVADTVMNIELQRKSYEAIINVTDQNEDELSEVEVTIDEVQKETDENGEAVFSSLYKDSYLCYADKEGYTTYEEEIMVEKDSTYHISLTRVYKLKFTVSNKEGEAIEGAEITADSESTVTDSDGEAIMELPSGEYTYTISAEGYKEYEKTTELTSNKTIDVTMVTDETGISKLESEGLKVYPNPADERLIIEKTTDESIEYQLVDMSGKTVQNGMLSQPVNQVDISDHSEGVYFIRFRTEEKYLKYQLIIQ
ncbi:MAG: C25 family cysteine peptidase [Bacteroidales bacterium]